MQPVSQPSRTIYNRQSATLISSRTLPSIANHVSTSLNTTWCVRTTFLIPPRREPCLHDHSPTITDYPTVAAEHTTIHPLPSRVSTGPPSLAAIHLPTLADIVSLSPRSWSCFTKSSPFITNCLLYRCRPVSSIVNYHASITGCSPCYREVFGRPRIICLAAVDHPIPFTSHPRALRRDPGHHRGTPVFIAYLQPAHLQFSSAILPGTDRVPRSSPAAANQYSGPSSRRAILIISYCCPSPRNIEAFACRLLDVFATVTNHSIRLQTSLQTVLDRRGHPSYHYRPLPIFAEPFPHHGPFC